MSARCEPPEEWGDKSLPEDSAIQAAHPLNGGDPDRMAEAMRLVGAKRSKAAFVELVNWLLAREAAAYQRGQREMREEIAENAHARAVAERLMRDKARRAQEREVAELHGDRAQAFDELVRAISAIPIKEKPE